MVDKKYLDVVGLCSLHLDVMCVEFVHCVTYAVLSMQPEDDIEYRTESAEGGGVLGTTLCDGMEGVYPESASDHVCPNGEHNRGQLQCCMNSNSRACT